MIESLANYPFLKAGLEDAALAASLSKGGLGSARHSVNLMHDALEFILYEVLQAAEKDIYKDGQNTIGLNEAIKVCEREKIDLPLIGTIRNIQKHRGDAKHHAQVPHDEAFNKMVAEFKVVLSRLVHEHFGTALVEIEKLRLMAYHDALFSSYRKYRNHNWKTALRFILAAFLHKHRSLLAMKDDFATGKIEDHKKIIGKLEADIKVAKYGHIDPKVVEYFAALPQELRALSEKADIQDAAEEAGTAYARLDEIAPSVLISRKGRYITTHLVQLDGIPTFGKGMSWSKWSRGDTPAKQEWDKKLTKLLRLRKKLTAAFGRPHDDSDEDRICRWWEFAVFDSVRWHTFHLDWTYNVSLESGPIGEDDPVRRETVMKLIHDEFMKAAKAK